MSFNYLLMLLVASTMYYELNCDQKDEEAILSLSMKKFVGYKQNIDKRGRHAPFRWGKREHVIKSQSVDL